MINKKFRDNWREIINYNSNVELGDKFKIGDKKVKIPLTPIDVDPSLLYHLFETLYPIFINDQQNVLDIIISNDGKDVKKLYFYETKKAGIHEIFEEMPTNLIKLHRKDLEDVDKFYYRILERFVKKKEARISSIRIFKEKAIDYINEYYVDIEDLPLDLLLVKGLNLLQKVFEQDLVIIYPEPDVFKFLKEILTFLNGIEIKNLFRLLYNLLPEFNYSFVFGSKELIVILHVQKIILSKKDKPYLRFKIISQNEVGINLNGLDKSGLLEAINKHLGTKKAYYLNQKDITSILIDLFHLPINLKGDDLQFIIQKILFGYRSYENHWYIAPKPILYNNLIRFLLRLLGLNLNLRKFSHWAIPEFFSTLLSNYFGLNSKILIIFTNVAEHKNLKIKTTEYLGKVAKHLILLEIENSTLIKIETIKKEKLIINAETGSFESIISNFSEKFGFISNIIILDKLLLQNFIRIFIFEHSKFAPFVKIRTLKMFKNQKYFYMFPELPLYKLMQKKRMVSFLKLIIPILIDKHEF